MKNTAIIDAPEQKSSNNANIEDTLWPFNFWKFNY